MRLMSSCVSFAGLDPRSVSGSIGPISVSHETQRGLFVAASAVEQAAAAAVAAAAASPMSVESMHKEMGSPENRTEVHRGCVCARDW